MPTDRIFSRDVDFQGFRLLDFITNPLSTTDREALTLGVADDGFTVWDTTEKQPYYWDGTAWVTWPAGGGGGDFPDISYTDLQNLTGGSTTEPYYMTTPGKEGFWAYSGTVADQSTDNEGTIIVTADLKQYKRIYDGTLDIRWFGGVSDFAASGTNMTGTNNITALNKMKSAAADNQPMLIPDVGTGWYFNGSMADVTNSKIVNLIIEGDTYHVLATASTPFINITTSGKEQKITHKGRAFGKLGIPDQSKANYDANSGPDWDTFNGILVRLIEANHSIINITFADGFSEVVRIEGGSVASSGSQENQVFLKWFYRNKYGVRFVCTDATGYIDKNVVFGGRISGQYPISFEGNLAGTPKTGVFTANMFYNILIEASDTGITGTGEIRYNSFIGCQIEGGTDTGVFSDTKIDLGPDAFSNSFIGNETINTTWLDNIGDQTSIWGTGIFSSDGVLVGNAALGGISPNRISVIGTQGISPTTRGNIPANVDIITFLGVSPQTADLRLNEFARIRVSGVDQAVSYDGKFVNITSAGTTTLVPPTGYVRLAAGSGAVVLSMDRSQLFSGSDLFIEQTGTGTVSIINSFDSTTVMATSQITSTGVYYVRYFSSSFTATKLGGTGTVSFTAVGSSPNANAASVSGSVVTLQPANVSFPGVVSTGAQDFSGAKNFLADVAVRRGVATTFTVENTSVTESTITSINVLSTVGAAFTKVNNNAMLELDRKDNTATAAFILGNGNTYAAGRQWSIGINPGNNHLIVNNQGLASNAFSIQSANNNIRIGTSTTDPGVKLQVDGDFKINAGSFFLGQLASQPGTTVNGQGYYDTTLNKLRVVENSVWVDWIGSGGGGGGVNAVGAVGAGTANAGSISGTTLTLHVATSTQPGLWSTGTQTLPGIKTFTGTHIFRTNSGTAGTAPFKIVEGSALMLVQENGAVERFGDDLWFTNSVTRQKLLTSSNVAVINNKTWQGAPIDPAYGGRDIVWEDGTPTITAGTGAGTGPTITFPASNKNSRGEIRVVPGTAPAASATVVTVTFSVTSGSGAIVTLTPANAAAASKAATVYAVSNSATTFQIAVGTTALTAAQSHNWYYQVRKV